MGWIFASKLVLPKSNSEVSEVEKGAKSEEIDVPTAPRLELHPEVTGAARIISEWPCQILRIFCCLLLGLALGGACAVLIHVILTSVLDNAAQAEHLHVATGNLTARRACALEALARQQAPRQCHIVILRVHPPQTLQLVHVLRNSYPNLNSHYHPDPEDYFENSPLSGFYGKGHPGMLDLAARALALWRHGGVSVDLDHPVSQLPPSGQHVQQGNGTVLQFPEPCHPALQELLALLEHNSGEEDNAENVVKRATDWMCRTQDHDQCLGVSILADETNHKMDDEMQCPIVRAQTEPTKN